MLKTAFDDLLCSLFTGEETIRRARQNETKWRHFSSSFALFIFVIEIYLL